MLGMSLQPGGGARLEEPKQEPRVCSSPTQGCLAWGGGGGGAWAMNLIEQFLVEGADAIDPQIDYVV